MHLSRPLRLLLTALLLAAPTPLAAAPPAATTPATTTLTPAHITAVLDEVARNITAHYVVPARRPAIVDALRVAQRQGRYAVTNPTELAARLSDDLARAGNDRHLWVRWSPEEYRALQLPPESAEAQAYFTALARRKHHGVEALRILGGNLRYLKYSQFMWEPDVSGHAIDDAIRFLAGGDAIIIDLRGNGGGHPAAVQYLISHFIKEPDRLLVTFHDELLKETRESRVLAHLPAGRITDTPLYVLMDGGTGSAAEEFVSHIKHFKLGTLVGRKTAGAAHNNSVLPVAPGFLVSISTGRPVHAVSGGDWEVAGVAPDLPASSREALDVATLHALDALTRKTRDAGTRATYAWARLDVEARLHPPAVKADQLARHVGAYGDRTIIRERGALVYRRPGRDDTRLTPLAADLFGLTGDPSRRIHFITTAGRTTTLEILFDDGQSQRFPRNADK